MKNLIYALLLLALWSCSKTEKGFNFNDIVGVQTEVSAKQFVETNELIDVPLKFPVLIDSYSDSDKARLKAAVYRFYKHVKIDDGLLSTTIKNAKDINVSDQIFKAFQDNLDEINGFITLNRKNGNDVQMPEVTDEYLNSLLE